MVSSRNARSDLGTVAEATVIENSRDESHFEQAGAVVTKTSAAHRFKQSRKIPAQPPSATCALAADRVPGVQSDEVSLSAVTLQDLELKRSHPR